MLVKIENKPQILAYLFILATLFIFGGNSVIDSLLELNQRIENNSNYLRANYMALTLIMGLMALLIFIILCAFSLTDKLKKTTSNKVLITAFSILCAGYFLKIPYHYYLNKTLTENNYYRCSQLESISIFSAQQIWLKNPDYCIKNTRPIRYQIHDWLDEMDRQNIQVSRQEAEEKIEYFFDTRFDPK